MPENFSIFNDTRELERLSEMIFVEGGTFLMGSDDGRNDEKPVHNVELYNMIITR